MTYLITAFGILFLVLGVIFFVRPALIRTFIEFAKVGKRVYIGGVIRIIIGALLLLATPKAAFPWLPGIIGALILISGILIFILGTQRIHAFMDWWYGLDDSRLRIMPVVAAIFGVLLIYSA